MIIKMRSTSNKPMCLCIMLHSSPIVRQMKPLCMAPLVAGVLYNRWWDGSLSAHFSYKQAVVRDPGTCTLYAKWYASAF